jgi:hypothetical protein
MKLINTNTGEVYGEILTNRSLTKQEALFALSIDTDSQYDIDAAKDKYDFIYNDDEGINRIDFDIIDLQY